MTDHLISNLYFAAKRVDVAFDFGLLPTAIADFEVAFGGCMEGELAGLDRDAQADAEDIWKGFHDTEK